MKRSLVGILMLSVAGALAPAAVSAESIFAADGSRASRLVLPPQEPSASGFGAASSFTREGSDAQGGRGARVTPLSAAASSLLLPGLGEQRLGHTLRARVFFGLEAASWISIGSFLWTGYSREQSYKDYAVVYAGVRNTDHPDDFYKAVGEYMSNDGPGGFNEDVRREARDLYYPNVEAMEAYYEQNLMTGDESWQWRTDDAHARYGILRDGSRYAYRVALYCAIAAAAVRIVSAADAMRTARIDARRPSSEPAISLDLEQRSRGIALLLRKSF